MKVKAVLTRLFFALFVALTVSTSALAQDADEALMASLSKKLDLDITAIADSPVPGLKQIFTDRGLFYISDDGNYFMQARIYNVAGSIVDETENALKDLRIKGIERFAESAIEFKADKEEYVINVFTDATCGYCRKLHNEMDQLNDFGITVRYLAWPRAGINSQVYRDTVSIWCSEDPHQAITDAKAGKSVDDASCENEVAEQFKFGQRIGVSGTPNIVLPNGSVIAGYQPASVLRNTIKDSI
ncbi:bifunctional protein-disulfide isomerase/oxidoreductase DsbC [Glaciecola petra]|uniref:Thiol:disulfide interchange protein n=1 Tax=Glaciecola petra TaxID=3075602 RepID=A0ABU2ZVC4_9ALTE|nr:bifunctional protein-disulfide isomerase/oxidoreductase DsbC [Aestuariibacter sp. P117]MDT0596598.1 bifunctional protein-disulfide isomerase/oxidoreductase DsbC [Aestuariibacter sp. P117]